MARIELSDDHLEASLVLAPGERVDASAIAALLEASHVAHGVDGTALAAAAAVVGPARHVVARGNPPVEAQDARIVLVVEGAEGDRAPVVQAGDLLARLVPATQPVPGVTVLGHVIQPPFARTRVLMAGSGTQLSPDGLEVRATVAGRPHVEGDRLTVRREHVVAGGVGPGSPPIDFDGDVVIAGDVLGPITVRAAGRVRVGGRVEEARIIAGGDVMLAGGARAQATVEAGGNVLARALEGAVVRCQGGLKVEQGLLHSDVDAIGAVAAAMILGGTVRSGLRGEVGTLGSTARTLTQVIVTPPAHHEREFEALEQEQSKLRGTLAYITPQIRKAQAAMSAGGATNQDALRKLLELATLLNQRDAAITERKRALGPARTGEPPRLEIHDQLHPGVSVWLGGAYLRVNRPYAGVSLVARGTEIVVQPR